MFAIVICLVLYLDHLKFSVSTCVSGINILSFSILFLIPLMLT